MSTLVIAEHNNKEIKPATLNTISAASQLNNKVEILIIGHECDSIAKELSNYKNI